MEPRAEAEKVGADAKLGAPGLADPTGAEGDGAEGGRVAVAVEGAPAKAGPEEVPISLPPVPPPPEAAPMPMSQPVPQPLSGMVHESMAAVAAGAEEEITITDQVRFAVNYSFALTPRVKCVSHQILPTSFKGRPLREGRADEPPHRELALPRHHQHPPPRLRAFAQDREAQRGPPHRQGDPDGEESRAVLEKVGARAF